MDPTRLQVFMTAPICRASASSAVGSNQPHRTREAWTAVSGPPTHWCRIPIAPETGSARPVPPCLVARVRRLRSSPRNHKCQESFQIAERRQ
jgi:hypothetical protein